MILIVSPRLPLPWSVWIRRTALFGAWVTLFLVLAEFGLRWIVPAPMRVPTLFDCEGSEIYGWAFPPNSPLPIANPDTGEIETVDRTNSRGWKDVEHSFSNETNAFRILVVGDSMTQGIVKMEDVYHRVLERLLKAEGYRAEVIALGVGGWSTDQEFQAYLHEGRKYRPHVIVSQFTHNDLDGLAGKDGLFDESLKPFAFKLVNGSLEIERRERRFPEPSAWERLDRFSLLHSRLYLFGRSLYFKHVAPLVLKRDIRNRFLAALESQDAGFQFVGEETEEQKATWDLYEAILARWRELAENDRSRLVMFTECCGESELQFGLRWICKRENGKILKKTDKGWIEIDVEKPRRRLEAICDELGIDLVPNSRFYERFEYDPHPTVAGNRAMAEDLRDFLLGHPVISQQLESYRNP